ncbi:hypothetical protein SKAU_G00036860 [Synaphobranchus kaupii]|uniref:Uncharacterized protein n=1 Tax=Synaphobranchus kaupii TaxID=118154 RepID=A0A9Q1GGA6_SYNKA|nr:hypothetical protein SKAU_G00036860 [Synaphobranchus kaupii]
MGHHSGRLVIGNRHGNRAPKSSTLVKTTGWVITGPHRLSGDTACPRDGGGERAATLERYGSRLSCHSSTRSASLSPEPRGTRSSRRRRRPRAGAFGIRRRKPAERASEVPRADALRSSGVKGP